MVLLTNGKRLATLMLVLSIEGVTALWIYRYVKKWVDHAGERIGPILSHPRLHELQLGLKMFSFFDLELKGFF